MSSKHLKQYSKEQLSEMSLLELAYELLTEKNEAVDFNTLLAEVVSLQGLKKDQITNKIAQFYTDINFDGRFTCLGDNRWGIKTWYPVDQIEDEVVHVVAKPKKKKKAKKALAVIEDFEELEEEDLDFDDIDDLDEDEDDDDDLMDDDIDVVEDDADFPDEIETIIEDDDELDIDENEDEDEDDLEKE